MATATEGPIKTVTHKGSSVFIYSTPSQKNGKTYKSHTLVYTQAGKRKRKVVASIEKAQSLAKSIAQQLSEGKAFFQVNNGTLQNR
jgi:spermidine synthase